MSGPVRGDWPDESWRGWWGDGPPYHAPTFVISHHEPPSIEMAGGTVCHFVTDGVEAALRRATATASAAELHGEIAGGVSTEREDLVAGHIDELHMAIAPVVLGQGEAPLMSPGSARDPGSAAGTGSVAGRRERRDLDAVMR